VEIFQGARRVRLKLLGGMTGGVLSSAAGGEGFGTGSGIGVSGPWAVSVSRPKCSRRPFSLF
jgi:hypothetical protein